MIPCDDGTAKEGEGTIAGFEMGVMTTSGFGEEAATTLFMLKRKTNDSVIRRFTLNETIQPGGSVLNGGGIKVGALKPNLL